MSATRNETQLWRTKQRRGIMFAIAVVSGRAEAQRQPETIPTVVAQAMTLDATMIGRPRFFNAQTPTDWPAALIPSGAKILGGGAVGDAQMFRMRVAVFALTETTVPRDAIRALLTGAGYVQQPPPGVLRRGGFVSNESGPAVNPYCKGGVMASFGVVDSTDSPRVVSIALIDGDAGRQYCAPKVAERERGRFPVTVPSLSPPRGTVSVNGGSSWGGDEGSMRSSLRTTLSADSVMMHYTAQLVAGGWVAEGKPAVAERIAVQHFLFSEGQDRWTAALLITAVGDRRHVMLQFTKRE
ncbi:hypothetical protein [Gemmatimonas sp.]|uniref:hypothetical protein n=1 Tax=Gemmatimonas sp. TaxID=1962908 RepID=UPI00286AFBCE|nr:hypothetical protein [Gemmatimonas sp.]